MPKLRHAEPRGEEIISVRFHMKDSTDEVVARLLQAVRRTELSLLKVFGDGDLVYPFRDRDPARRASSWRAELVWRSTIFNQGWHLEAFLMRAELFLDLPGGVRLELGGGRRNPEGETVA